MPLGRGFDRYYGFLGGTTSEYEPWLTHDNHFVAAPETPQDGYHLLTDMTNKACEFIVEVKNVDPVGAEDTRLRGGLRPSSVKNGVQSRS